ncbi:MAG: molybdenum cofactor biosynthesis protein MoaE [Planctomycetota bacterium]
MHRVELTPGPIDVGALTAHLHTPTAGGVCTFLGVTRDDDDIVALHYEAHAAMAEKQLHTLADTAAKRWPIRRLALVHRLGNVPAGQASVFVGVATPHRGEAFDACRWLIDTLKADLPVWKRDLHADGQTTWTPPNREWQRTLPTDS